MKELLPAFKSLGLFLGQKLDGLSDQIRKLSLEVRDSRKRVDLDLSTLVIEKLQDTQSLNIDRISKTMEKTGKEYSANLAKIAAALSKISQTEQEDSDDAHERAMLVLLQDIAGGQENLARVLSKDSTSELKAILKQLIDATKANKPHPEREDDYTPIVSALQKLDECMNEVKQAVRATDAREKIADLAAAVRDLASKKQTDTFKLEDSQFRTLAQAGNSVSVAGPLTARNVEITNVAMAAANTQYSHTFGSNVVSWVIKLRSQNTLLLYSFTTGTLPTSGDGTAYATVPQNGLQSQQGVEWSGKTIYLQTPGTSQVAEIIEYTA